MLKVVNNGSTNNQNVNAASTTFAALAGTGVPRMCFYNTTGGATITGFPSGGYV